MFSSILIDSLTVVCCFGLLLKGLIIPIGEASYQGESNPVLICQNTERVTPDVGENSILSFAFQNRYLVVIVYIVINTHKQYLCVIEKQ